MLKNYNFTIIGIGNVLISAHSWYEAQQIIQAYIDKHSLDWVITYDG